MAKVSVDTKGIEVGPPRGRQLIDWAAIRQWDIAPYVDYDRRTKQEVVKASVLSIGFDLDGEKSWFHVDNTKIGERSFMVLLRALREHAAKKGPKDFDGVPPHVAAAAAAGDESKPRGKKPAAAPQPVAGEWPRFDERASDQDELMRQFVELGEPPPRRRKAMPAATYRKITALCEQGTRLEKKARLADAWASYGEAFALIPEPKINWDATAWVLSVAADVAFHAKQYPRALGMLNNAVNCSAPDVNPFVNLRIGQCLYELGDKKQAAHYLTLAYMAEGRDIFREDDPKYFRLLEKVLKPPKGRKRL